MGPTASTAGMAIPAVSLLALAVGIPVANLSAAAVPHYGLPMATCLETTRTRGDLGPGDSWLLGGRPGGKNCTSGWPALSL